MGLRYFIIKLCMKTKKFFIAVLATLLSVSAFAQDTKPQFKWYGFIRNYFTFDTRESVAGTEDFFYYVPKDEKIVSGDDLNAVNSFRFAALTSRLGLDVTGYEYNGLKIAAKIEGDFYAGVSGVTGTATFRLRQAYATISKDSWSLKAGQAWHPMAADMPDVFSLNTGAPFGPFSRTPEMVFDYKASDSFSLTAAAIWQMQYVSAGPEGASANYIKYGCTPEFYFGLNFTKDNFIARAGVDVLSIKPRRFNATGTSRVDDRITTVSPFIYLQYKSGDFSVKAKSIFAQGGEHMNLNGGYGVTKDSNLLGEWNYTATRNSSTWVSLAYGKKVQGILFGGYVKNFGTDKELIGTSSDYFFFSKNSFSNMNSMFRVTPSVIWNLGKLALGLEYEVTGIQYGSWDKSKPCYGLATSNLHWVVNNRIQGMFKYTF